MSGSKNAFEALLNRVCADWSGKGYGYLSVGFCEGDERGSVASSYATQQLSSTIYIVFWQDTNVSLLEMNSPVHLETATL